MINRFFYSAVAYQLITKTAALRRRLDPVVVVGLLNLGVWVAVAMVKRKHVQYHKVKFSSSMSTTRMQVAESPPPGVANRFHSPLPAPQGQAQCMGFFSFLHFFCTI